MSVLTIAPVTAADDRLKTLTYPRFAEYLTPAALAAPWFHVIAATTATQPVGMAMLIQDAESSWRLMSVAVSAQSRRNGIGLALMQAAAQWAATRSLPTLYSVHGGEMRGVDAWQGLLDRAGWSPPVLCLLSLTGHATWATEARREWDDLFVRLAASGFTVTPWCQRSVEDEAILAHLAVGTGRMAPQGVTDVLPGASLVIREHGLPVGWVLATTGTQPGDIYYPAGYVTRRLQRMGWLVAALVEACLSQQRTYGADGTCSFQTAGDNRAMQDFMLRRLDKWTIRRNTHYQSSKTISP
ncbi:GNAT family N-acetyltransferase [Magnetospirillum sulfuroxidans]|uniref:GNAT family N-acetyltransferase n=1 Tax=Magnetospirillum sulfuroxidans TaxID=611300 RepID=A0ABS5IDN3_9PROT|nr:GNAT family N-acetyltransferase [Magnetospirillum sulfuroxidans]MBR9972538.1 GNAT family N-acetyltransferase [Magnetospirillum sulfuroxidans]